MTQQYAYTLISDNHIRVHNPVHFYNMMSLILRKSSCPEDFMTLLQEYNIPIFQWYTMNTGLVMNNIFMIIIDSYEGNPNRKEKFFIELFIRLLEEYKFLDITAKNNIGHNMIPRCMMISSLKLENFCRDPFLYRIHKKIDDAYSII